MENNNFQLNFSRTLSALKKVFQTDKSKNQLAAKQANTYITVDVSVRPPVDIAQKYVLQVFLAQQVEPQSLHWQSGCSVAAKSTPELS